MLLPHAARSRFPRNAASAMRRYRLNAEDGPRKEFEQYRRIEFFRALAWLYPDEIGKADSNNFIYSAKAKWDRFPHVFVDRENGFVAPSIASRASCGMKMRQP